MVQSSAIISSLALTHMPKAWESSYSEVEAPSMFLLHPFIDGWGKLDPQVYLAAHDLEVIREERDTSTQSSGSVCPAISCTHCLFSFTVYPYSPNFVILRISFNELIILLSPFSISRWQQISALLNSVAL